MDITSYINTPSSIRPVNHCQQSFEHLEHLSIEEILRNRVSFLMYQFFDDDLVSERFFLNIILREQSPILNEAKIR